MKQNNILSYAKQNNNSKGVDGNEQLGMGISE